MYVAGVEDNRANMADFVSHHLPLPKLSPS